MPARVPASSRLFNALANALSCVRISKESSAARLSPDTIANERITLRNILTHLNDSGQIKIERRGSEGNVCIPAFDV
jgi:hypothetical protein